jgi:hypothetical protein
VAEAPGAALTHRLRPEQATLGWLLRRAWAEGRSDGWLDGPSDRETLARATRLAALSAVVPADALDRRWAVYEAARMAANASYVATSLQAGDELGAQDTGVDSYP